MRILFITPLFLNSLSIIPALASENSGTDTETTVTKQSINHITVECRRCLLNETENPELRDEEIFWLAGWLDHLLDDLLAVDLQEQGVRG